MGRYYYSQSEHDAALEEYAIAQKALPDSSDLHLNIAAALRRKGRFEEAVGEFERAMELSPRSAELARERAATNILLRRYAEAIRLYDVSIADAPYQTLAFWEKGLSQILATGAVGQARTTLERMPDTGDAQFVWAWVGQEVLERDYIKALSRVSATRFEWLVNQEHFQPKALLLAQLYQLLRKPDRARAAFADAASLLEREKNARPDDARVYSALGLAYAGLGRKQDAVLEARRGLELRPPSKDALVGPTMIMNLARVYAEVGEPDAALDQIERLLSTPAKFSSKSLELDPVWDPLRQEPRYRALIDKFDRPH